MAVLYLISLVSILVTMAPTVTPFSVVSFNCKGFLHSRDYCKDIIQQVDPLIICLQETWHLPSTASVFATMSSDYLYHDTSGVDCSWNIIHGRSSGGLVNIYKKDIADKIKLVKCDNRRVCALVINDKGCLPLLLINVYMSCDNASIKTVNPDFVYK